MKHYRIAIAPEETWSTLGELLEGQPIPLDALPAPYLARERAFVEVGRRFLDVAGPDVQYRDMHVFDDYPARRNPDFHPAVYDTLDGTADDIDRALKAPTFGELSRGDQLFIFQLAVRDLLSLSLVGHGGVALSTMDDGFYWFVSVPDDVDLARLVGDTGAEVSESIDIFDPA